MEKAPVLKTGEAEKCRGSSSLPPSAKFCLNMETWVNGLNQHAANVPSLKNGVRVRVSPSPLKSNSE